MGNIIIEFSLLCKSKITLRSIESLELYAASRIENTSRQEAVLYLQFMLIWLRVF